jgi:hypothetical protein
MAYAACWRNSSTGESSPVLETVRSHKADALDAAIAVYDGHHWREHPVYGKHFIGYPKGPDQRDAKASWLRRKGMRIRKVDIVIVD